MAKKAQVTLGNIPLAGNQPISWQFISGVQPYQTTVSVYYSQEINMRNNFGKPLDLIITNSSGVTTKIQNVYILRQVASDSPNRLSYLISDKRWRWPYKLVARDYNMIRKTGDRTTDFDQVPVETRLTFDKYDYRPYSLNGEAKWTAEDAVRDVMSIVEGLTDEEIAAQGRAPGNAAAQTANSWRIDSFPLGRGAKGKSREFGQFTLQNVQIRDAGDIAVARMLSYVPGASVYVNAEGIAVIYDSTDIRAVERYFNDLPSITWDGESPIGVDYEAIRPQKVQVYYQREIELLVSYRDDYGSGDLADPSRDEPFIENVVPTVLPETTISYYDPETGERTNTTVPPGTWVNVRDWLDAMDDDKPDGSLPWNFETIAEHWLHGDLEAMLGARGLDLDSTANYAMAVQTLRQHFRQTFRINRRYMERIRSLRAVRAALLDPITGARAPAAVWGQACIIPTNKGRMAPRNADDAQFYYRNVDYLDPSEVAGVKITSTAPGPTQVNIIDEELGVFRLDWITSPYGTIESFIPCNLVSNIATDSGSGKSKTKKTTVPTRDLRHQEDRPMGEGMRVENGTNGIFLAPSLEYKVLLTIVSSGLNNLQQFHSREVQGAEVNDVFRTEFGIDDGKGPTMQVFIPPNEVTARYAWETDNEATQSVKEVLGIVEKTQTKVPQNSTERKPGGGLVGGGNRSDQDLNGFVLVNANRELADHAKSVAAEMLARYANGVEGAVATGVPLEGLKIVGNMNGAAINVAQAPSGKVNAIHSFSGQQRPVSRFGFLPDSARAIILGTLTFKD